MGARRALLLFRVALYATLVALIAWLLAGRGEEPQAARPSTKLFGTSAQGERLLLVLDGRRPTYLRVRIVLGCDRGATYRVTWTVVPPQLRRDGDRLVVRSGGSIVEDGREVGYGRLDVSGRVEGARVRGTMGYTAGFWRGGRCRARDVTFAAQR